MTKRFIKELRVDEFVSQRRQMLKRLFVWAISKGFFGLVFAEHFERTYVAPSSDG